MISHEIHSRPQEHYAPSTCIHSVFYLQEVWQDKNKKVNLTDWRSKFEFMQNNYLHCWQGSIFLPREIYRMSNVFLDVKTYRNTQTTSLPCFQSHALSGTATKYWRHAKSSMKCLSVWVYASLSHKILLAMKNTETHAEHLVCKNITALILQGHFCSLKTGLSIILLGWDHI